MSNQQKDSGIPHNEHPLSSQRENQANHSSETRPLLEISNTEHQILSGIFDFEQMIHSLHELFEHDRRLASKPDSTRCGICYLHFALTELQYRNDGFYVCSGCNQALGHQCIPMLHKQQKI